MALAFAVAGAACACDPQNAQYLVHLDTDAPLAVEPGGVLAPGDPTPLFDHVQITAYDGCTTDCSRVFAVDRSMFSGGQMPTFGLYSPQATEWGYVSIELYRAAGVDSSGFPQPNAAIGGDLYLPPQAARSGAQDVYVQLRVSAIGAQGTLASSPTPQPKLTPWQAAYPTACAGAPGPGEVCVPSGGFWLGNTLDVDLSYQKLAAVSSFYMDATEVTVADFRASGLATVDPTTGLSSDPLESSGPGDSAAAGCPYSSQSAGAGADAVALDCVSWTQAQAYCQSKGKDLATWLQFEYVAGDLTSQLYPWGRDEPACSDAVFGRNVANAGTSSSQCAEADTPYGPVAPRSGARDHVDLPGGSLYDLAGNVSEWVKDYGSSSEPCSTSNLLVDFVCTDSTSTMGARVAKGGAWFNQPASLRAADAIAGPPTTTANGVGFRCARPAAP